MGGTTITVYGDTEKDILDKLRKQIVHSATIGLYPDSAAVIIRGDDLTAGEGDEKVADKKKAKLFNVKLNEWEMTVEFEEVEKGRIFHVGVAAAFSKAPEPGQLLGTVHLHT